MSTKSPKKSTSTKNDEMPDSILIGSRTISPKQRKQIWAILVAIFLSTLILRYGPGLISDSDATSDTSAVEVNSSNDLIDFYGHNHTHSSATGELTDGQLIRLDALFEGSSRIGADAAVGYVMSCGGESLLEPSSAVTASEAEQAGWFNSEAGTWSRFEKPFLPVTVEAGGTGLSDFVIDDQRQLSSNGVPVIHTTGTFTNPYKQYEIATSVTANPEIATSPTCIDDFVGIMNSGVLIAAANTNGRDDFVYEETDQCGGTVLGGELSGLYVYRLPICSLDRSEVSAHSDQVGWALDGFGIFGVKGQGGAELGSGDLDMCHGHVHTVTVGGDTKQQYHYHLSNDYPYTIGCFRGEPATLQIGDLQIQ